MALTVTLEEQYRDSRGFSVSRDNAEQTFIFFICGNFLDEALDDPTYGPDDDLVAIKAAYSIVPPLRQVPTYAGGQMLLSLASIAVNQLAPDQWRVEAKYDIPQGGGAAGGGYGATEGLYTGPDAGEGNAQSFYQISFNVAASLGKRNQSLGTLACQKANGIANTTVPYSTGQPAPIGHTVDGVEGGDVYLREFSFEVTKYMRPEELTVAYVRRLYRMSTTLNNNTFFGFPAYSVLFLEASASSDLFQVVPVTFSFKMRPNFILLEDDKTILQDPNEDNPALMFDQVGDPYFPLAQGPPDPAFPPDPDDLLGSPVPFSGWSQLDYRYRPAPDDASKMHLQKPYLRTVHRMYEASNFARLQI